MYTAGNGNEEIGGKTCKGTSTLQMLEVFQMIVSRLHIAIWSPFLRLLLGRNRVGDSHLLLTSKGYSFMSKVCMVHFKVKRVMSTLIAHYQCWCQSFFKFLFEAQPLASSLRLIIGPKNNDFFWYKLHGSDVISSSMCLRYRGQQLMFPVMETQGTAPPTGRWVEAHTRATGTMHSFTR